MKKPTLWMDEVRNRKCGGCGHLLPCTYVRDARWWLCRKCERESRMTTEQQYEWEQSIDEMCRDDE